MMLLDEIQTVTAGSSAGSDIKRPPARGLAAASSSATSPSLAEWQPTGDERSAEADNVDMQQLERTLNDLSHTLEAKGAALKFEIVSDQGVVQVEVSEKNSNKVLMRIPPEGVLRVGKDGGMTLGGLLNRQY
ncbi:flagellar protein FlaG [Desulfovibrio oxamicus]|uniref:Flagellar protein FlaG n=1 Tax=Nitratidesulfovibrio oxamicus TaxID=32016 RepID=A0ABS0J9G1_9BACT|nr:flagellar protein FlaG [Nitratidesulfovibrio oxamicus]MBG3879006.1 flagellar protein FlaG [Nitratidesulfovibrio oxamicus]